METVPGVFHSYPSFLWITGCKILFIVGDQICKNHFSVAQRASQEQKKCYKS